MKLQLTITAEKYEGQDEFQGQPIKDKSHAPFVMVKHQGAFLKIDKGMWLITFHDGTKEVWNEQEVIDNTDYAIGNESNDQRQFPLTESEITENFGGESVPLQETQDQPYTIE